MSAKYFIETDGNLMPNVQFMKSL